MDAVSAVVFYAKVCGKKVPNFEADPEGKICKRTNEFELESV